LFNYKSVNTNQNRRWYSRTQENAAGPMGLWVR